MRIRKNLLCFWNLYYVWKITVLILGFINTGESKKSNICGLSHLLFQQGIIHSPNYPTSYPGNTNCSWTILSPPNTTLTIILKDVDIEEDEDCVEPPCCKHNWLMLPVDNGDKYQQICGRNLSVKPIRISKEKTTITFVSTKLISQRRGFSLTYAKETSSCQINEFKCGDGKCLPGQMQCDRVAQCIDQSDEIGCEVPGCEEGIACANDQGCYSPLSRCDSQLDCTDGSDEFNCPEDICIGENRLCNNAKCRHHLLWCNGIDDCGDNSDEDNCIRNSVISASIMGCLLCGLLLILAVFCTLRAYTKRTVESSNHNFNLPPHIASRLSMTHSISLPAVMDDEFFQREPPPAYSVAISQSSSGLQSNINLHNHRPRIHHSSRTRRHRPRHVVKPPSPPPSTETSNQSSPSRDSITSSSYLSNDDNVHLIDV